jgi:NAD+ kinase
VKIERVAIVTHAAKLGVEELVDRLTGWLTDRGIAVDEGKVDLVVSLGGDGTMLRAAQIAHQADAPLLGVNLGTLGYLTEVEAGEEIAALEKIIAGGYVVEERMILRCEDSTGSMSYVGLNEVLIERGTRHRLVTLNVWIGGERLASFNADGVIVATPTGSTAYALSAGGPIVSPRAQVMVLVPVSAHMVFTRPFVLAPDEIVEIEVDPAGEPASLSLDGALGCDLTPGTRMLVRRHFRPLQLVRLTGPGFVERLRRKLGLPT